jgi:2-polyprenyl-3-methyl-5-hydroxy-6-metoxy-1,4-benzoquinol methylase
VKWLFGDITGPGTVNGTYDVVTLIETLEHIELAELPGFVDALRRCTTDDGKLFLTVPSKNVPVSGHHVQHFDVPTLTAILGKRFAIEQVVHLNRNAPAVKLVFRYLTSNRFFVIVHPRILTGLYTWYRKRFLIGTETDTKRIFLACRAV